MRRILHVAALLALLGVLPHRVHPDRGMRPLDHRRACEPLRIEPGHCPGDGRAPVVPDHVEPFVALGAGQCENVGGREAHAIVSRALRLARKVVSALVRRDDAEPAFGQRLEIVAPGEPELRKSVQQDDERTVSRSRGRAVQRHIVDGDETKLDQRLRQSLDPMLVRLALSRGPPPDDAPGPFDHVRSNSSTQAGTVWLAGP